MAVQTTTNASGSSGTLGAIGLGLSLGSTIGGAIGAIFEGKAQRGWYSLNAYLAESEGRMAAFGAKLNIKRFREQADSFLGNQVAAYGKAGVKFEGSPAAVYFKSAKDLEMDALISEYNADFNTWNKEMQASMYKTYGSAVYGASVNRAINQTISGLGSTLLFAGGK